MILIHMVLSTLNSKSNNIQRMQIFSLSKGVFDSAHINRPLKSKFIQCMQIFLLYKGVLCLCGCGGVAYRAVLTNHRDFQLLQLMDWPRPFQSFQSGAIDVLQMCQQNLGNQRWRRLGQIELCGGEVPSYFGPVSFHLAPALTLPPFNQPLPGWLDVFLGSISWQSALLDGSQKEPAGPRHTPYL